jgi:DNA-binding CsgD family transcriptional regulator
MPTEINRAAPTPRPAFARKTPPKKGGRPNNGTADTPPDPVAVRFPSPFSRSPFSLAESGHGVRVVSTASVGGRPPSCEGCGCELPPYSGRGRPRKFCPTCGPCRGSGSDRRPGRQVSAASVARRQRVARLRREGLKRGEIAARLGVSANVVRNDVAVLLRAGRVEARPRRDLAAARAAADVLLAQVWGVLRVSRAVGVALVTVQKWRSES